MAREERPDIGAVERAWSAEGAMPARVQAVGKESRLPIGSALVVLGWAWPGQRMMPGTR